MTSSFLLENIIPLTTDHSRGAIINSTPISFICSVFKAVVSKIILPIGCHTANPITIREVHTAAISFQLLKNGMPNKVLFSDLHSNTCISWVKIKVTSAPVRAVSKRIASGIAGLVSSREKAAMVVSPISIPRNKITLSRPPEKMESVLFLGF